MTIDDPALNDYGVGPIAHAGSSAMWIHGTGDSAAPEATYTIAWAPSFNLNDGIARPGRFSGWVLVDQGYTGSIEVDIELTYRRNGEENSAAFIIPVMSPGWHPAYITYDPVAGSIQAYADGELYGDWTNPDELAGGQFTGGGFSVTAWSHGSSVTAWVDDAYAETIPEPASILVLATGLIGIAGHAARRRRR